MTDPHPIVTVSGRRLAERDYPAWICGPCGAKYGSRVGNPYATWHRGVCCICGQQADVTEPRDFGHLKPGWNAQEAQ